MKNSCRTDPTNVIVSSIIYQLCLHFNFEVKFVRRQANMVAHTLARTACSWASHRFFILIHLVLNIGWLMIIVKFLSINLLTMCVFGSTYRAITTESRGAKLFLICLVVAVKNWFYLYNWFSLKIEFVVFDFRIDSHIHI